jgi:hypothetical protein
VHNLRGMDALTLQLLTWIADRPRRYGETMDAWHTTCPRMPVWKDAISAGLIRIDGAGTMRERTVCLTARGRVLLGAHAPVALA